MLNLRRQLPSLQRALMGRAAAHGVTQDCAASHLECSAARVSFWTSSGASWRAMTLEDLLGLVELTADPLSLLRPLHDALGLVAIHRPTTAGQAGGRLESGVLGATVLLGELTREVQAATADGDVEPAEAEAVRARLRDLRHQLDGLEATLAHAPRVVGSRR